jgi:hypothetical protein
MKTNEEFIYWFSAIWVLSAIIQIIYIVINSKIDERNKILNNLYIKLYERIKDEEITNGLCKEVDSIFNSENYIYKDIFINHFLGQKPSFFVNNSFYRHYSFSGRAFWWNNNFGQVSTNQRKLFIKMLIKKTSLNKTNLIDVV